MNRRGFLKTLAGLAALAAAQNSLGEILPAPESFKYTPIDAGPGVLVHDQMFILDRPYVIELPNTVITRCLFIARGDWDGPMMQVGADFIEISSCMFRDERANAGGPCIVTGAHSHVGTGYGK